jgi:hypothetical protein
MRQWLDTTCYGVQVLLDEGEAAQYCGLEPSEDEWKRHSKPILLPQEILGSRLSHSGSYVDTVRALIRDAVWWQVWGIRCERARNDPEPGYDANGAPVWS